MVSEIIEKSIRAKVIRNICTSLLQKNLSTSSGEIFKWSTNGINDDEYVSNNECPRVKSDLRNIKSDLFFSMAGYEGLIAIP